MRGRSYHAAGIVYPLACVCVRRFFIKVMQGQVASSDIDFVGTWALMLVSEGGASLRGFDWARLAR
jgi:hypothetical protein